VSSSDAAVSSKASPDKAAVQALEQALRTHIAGQVDCGETITTGWESDEVKSALDLCLACKACKSECPVSVDMATYKSGVSRPLLRPTLAPAAASSIRPYRLVGDGGIPGAAARQRTRIRPTDRTPDSVCCRNRIGTPTSAVRAGDLPTLDGSEGARAGRSGGHPVVGHVHELLLPAGRTGGGSRSGTSGIPRDPPPQTCCGGRFMTSACSSRRESTLTPYSTS
jgi:ferredoxin